MSTSKFYHYQYHTWSWVSCTKQNIEYPFITYSCIRDI